MSFPFCRSLVLPVAVDLIKVLIEKGRLLSGIICKKTLGPTAGGLLHVLVMEEGVEIARRFYGNIQTVVNNWLLINGFRLLLPPIKKIPPPHWMS